MDWFAASMFPLLKPVAFRGDVDFSLEVIFEGFDELVVGFFLS